MTNLINCGTCGYPLAPEERTTLVEKDGVMVKPAREWVGLTDDEFEDIEMGCRSTPFGKIEAMKQVEAKLKEKNNG